jgi:D-threo-aldose 1-dehydrogenase
MSIRDKLISGPLGFGSTPLGNMLRSIPEAAAAATVDAAWQQGIRYFATAPLYGAGLSKMRLGRALAKHKRDQYVLSSKVGRLILDEVESGPRHLGEKGNLCEFGLPTRMVNDYSADRTLRSIEDSLKHLGIDRRDFVWIHDLSRDFRRDEWFAPFEPARTGRSVRSPHCARRASSRPGVSVRTPSNRPNWRWTWPRRDRPDSFWQAATRCSLTSAHCSA